ncbi:MAG TPA: UdgX family uracil-DNA binding protein [Ramlibacter sp.]|nr:UdgX family uracil-DNA binding protein [Ramlibacter sp.]
MRVELAGETDFAGFRTHARSLLARGVAPDDVHWSTQSGSDLFGDGDGASRALHHEVQDAQVPAAFVQLCESVALHSDPQRFALMYRLLWRLVREESLRHDPLDPDILLARKMAHAVGHDMHKMRAFVRFRPVRDPHEDGKELHVAWFEPQHHIVEANAQWFRRRFAAMRWALLTPLRCAQWDGAALHFREGASRAQAPPADAGEALWLTYYASIFNPARLKLQMMRKEMPRRYWHNLPEAALISPLSAQAVERAGHMIEQSPTRTHRRLRARDPAVFPIQVPIETLQGLGDAVSRCNACPIGSGATQAVMGEGPLQPALMLVGEQPGDQEDLTGRAFVGPAGQLLERALAGARIARESVFVTNAVRHFKYELRGKRRIHKTPSQAEAAACSSWLEHEIALVRPQALVALGATAARSLLQRTVAVTTERGRWHERTDGLRVFVTWHPSALLRMEPAKQDGAFEQFVGDLRAALARRW